MCVLTTKGTIGDSTIGDRPQLYHFAEKSLILCSSLRLQIKS